MFASLNSDFHVVFRESGFGGVIVVVLTLLKNATISSAVQVFLTFHLPFPNIYIITYSFSSQHMIELFLENAEEIWYWILCSMSSLQLNIWFKNNFQNNHSNSFWIFYLLSLIKIEIKSLYYKPIQKAIANMKSTNLYHGKKNHKYYGPI